MSSTTSARRTLTRAAAALIAIASTVAVLAVSAPGRAESVATHHHHAMAVKSSPKAAALHDRMRKLWEDHVTWTRLAIVSFAHDLPDLAPTEARLLRNQVDIGNAVKPYYGRAAGNQLTALLKDHILGAVALLEAAKSGDQAMIARRTDEWYANGNQIADFLHQANPSNWPRNEMRRMMKVHLDTTLQEAVDRLSGKYAEDIRDYDVVHRHILAMADMLSSGIVKQFPNRFR